MKLLRAPDTINRTVNGTYDVKIVYYENVTSQHPLTNLKAVDLCQLL